MPPDMNGSHRHGQDQGFRDGMLGKRRAFIGQPRSEWEQGYDEGRRAGISQRNWEAGEVVRGGLASRVRFERPLTFQQLRG